MQVPQFIPHGAIIDLSKFTDGAMIDNSFVFITGSIPLFNSVSGRN